MLPATWMKTARLSGAPEAGQVPFTRFLTKSSSSYSTKWHSSSGVGWLGSETKQKKIINHSNRVYVIFVLFGIDLSFLTSEFVDDGVTLSTTRATGTASIWAMSRQVSSASANWPSTTACTRTPRAFASAAIWTSATLCLHSSTRCRTPCPSSCVASWRPAVCTYETSSSTSSTWAPLPSPICPAAWKGSHLSGWLCCSTML